MHILSTANSHNTVLYTMIIRPERMLRCARMWYICACARQTFLCGIASCLADTHRATMPSIEVSQCVCLLTLLWSLVEVHSQTSTPFISFMGNTLANHSYVEFSEVGRAGDGSDSVRCRSELVMCCKEIFVETGSSPVELFCHSLDLLMILLKVVERRLLTYVVSLHSLQVDYIDVILHLMLMTLQQCRPSMWEYTTMEVLNSTVFSLRSHKNCITHSYR